MNFTVTLGFTQNATYDDKHKKLAGDRSASLTALNITTTDGTNTETVAYAPKAKEFHMAYNQSFDCHYNFSFTKNETKKVSHVSIKNLRIQPFIPAAQKDFSPASSSNSACPANASKSTKTIGLIVGGVLTGLALFGIIGFAISRCRSDRSGYEAIQ